MTNQPSKTYNVSSRTRVRVTASDASAAPLGLSGVLGDADERSPVGPFTEFVDDATAPVTDGLDEIIVIGESRQDRSELDRESPISHETARPK